eukprot:scaffold26216_cov191-Cylindrotheca_fusiformis.AAC.1
MRFWLWNTMLSVALLGRRCHGAFHRSMIGWHRQRQLPPSMIRKFCQRDKQDYDGNALSMENLYREWTIEQDELLWRNKEQNNMSTIELASLLGRGLRGVEARLNKLQDVNSPAYERLFARGNKQQLQLQQQDEEACEKTKLVPAREVLRWIEFDHQLSASDFSMLHYDRVDDAIVESPLDAPNNSVSGTTEALLTKALPEHRIVGFKYKDRVVWDRNERMDLVFSGKGIYHVIEHYDEWKRERDQVQEWNRKRQKIVAQRIQQVLGVEQFENLQGLSSELLSTNNRVSFTARKSALEQYVNNALGLFRKVREDHSLSNNPSLIPNTDILALEEISELVAVLPEPLLRGQLLTEISFEMSRLEGKGQQHSKAGTKVALSEEDLSETFVRGSGPGGQKVNKTSNRVVLVHEPTKLRVECQDTRSLQQNRKIARKRLLEKLDEHLNGNQSNVSRKQEKAAQKRQKSKAKSRARQRKKQLEKQQQQQL